MTDGESPAQSQPTPSDDSWLPAEISELPYRISAQLGIAEGRVQLTALRLEPIDPTSPTAITTERLTRLPLQDVLERAVESAVRLGRPEATNLMSALATPRYSWVAEHYRQVGLAHDEALVVGQSPNEFIRRRWKVTRATADQWLEQARQLGQTFVDDAAVAPPAPPHHRWLRRRHKS